MDVAIVEVRNDAGLRAWLGVRNQLERDDPWTLEQLVARRSAEPQRSEFVAFAEHEAVGVASVGPKGSPDDLAYGYVGVLSDREPARIRTVLYETVRQAARRSGRSRLELWASDNDLSAVAFLEARGFIEVMREAGLALELSPALRLPPPRPPQGVALEPVVVSDAYGDGAYAVAARTWRDIPGETGISTKQAWLHINVAHAPEGALVALHRGLVVGFAGLHTLAAPGLYEHGLLAVLPQYRRQGIANALKLAQIRWAQESGGRRLVTWNAETNDAVRGLNLALGYQPLPTTIAF